jgi:LysR family hydrogen peroxide-inducible transcriptional activator
MTINQLEYIIAVDNYRHFVTAAEKCFITQPTLSMQIHKLENELGIIIFNRRIQPVVPTKIGEAVIKQAREVINEFNKINEQVKVLKNDISGVLRIGIIPTLAPYLLPLFIGKFAKEYPDIELIINEYISKEIIHMLKIDILDIGILSTPLNDNDIIEMLLFYEKILIFVDNDHYMAKLQNIKVSEIPVNDLWTLSEKHCFKAQVVNLCNKSSLKGKKYNLQYQSGSFENLIRFSEITHRLTLIPELLVSNLGIDKKNNIKEIIDPVPAREISLAVNKSLVKENLAEILKTEILSSIPEKMKEKKGLEIIEWK